MNNSENIENTTPDETIDFYRWGYRACRDGENYKSLRKKIANQYGNQAAYDFEAGYTHAQEDIYTEGESQDWEVPDGLTDQYGELTALDGAGQIEGDDNLINNSYYPGGRGVSVRK